MGVSARVAGPVVLILLASGCVSEGSGPAGDESSASPELGFGAMVGTVTNDELQPIENITITVMETQDVRSSRSDGTFFFERLREGAYTVVAEHPRYETQSRNIFVLRDLQVEADFTLTLQTDFRPVNFTVQFPGHYDCALEYLLITGDCGIAYENVTCRLNYCQSDPVFSEKYQFPADIKPRWETVVAELTWTVNPSNGVDGMRMYLENTNASGGGGHAKKVARADGNQQPLTLRVDRGYTYPGADRYDNTNIPAFVPADGRVEQIRVFPKGHAWDTTRQVCEPTRGCLLGVGGALNIQFKVYLTVFYNEAAPAGFSAVPA